jgi:hypothetical protein
VGKSATKPAQLKSPVVDLALKEGQ